MHLSVPIFTLLTSKVTLSVLQCSVLLCKHIPITMTYSDSSSLSDAPAASQDELKEHDLEPKVLYMASKLLKTQFDGASGVPDTKGQPSEVLCTWFK